MSTANRIDRVNCASLLAGSGTRLMRFGLRPHHILLTSKAREAGKQPSLVRGAGPRIPARAFGSPDDARGHRQSGAPHPFGDKAPLQDPDGNGTPFVLNLRFPGQYFDAETGLHYNYFRDYEPGTGRYIQSDPIGLRGGMSTFGYVGGSPLGSIDFFGLAETTVDAFCVQHGAAACAQIATPKTPPLAPEALGSGLTAGIWCWLTGCIVPNDAEYSPIPRRDMTSTEERQFDRYCVGSDDPCGALKAATAAAIADAKVKMDDMLRDKGNMFGGSGWDTHSAGLRGRMDNIAAMISLGKKLGCDMSAEIALFSVLIIPKAPL